MGDDAVRTPKGGVRSIHGRWWMAVALVTIGILTIVIAIGLASFIVTVNPLAVELLALAMLVALGLVSVYVVSRSLSEHP